ncbi:MAG: hypothetical protein ABJB10_19010, partial [Mesorhizobium sp.]
MLFGRRTNSSCLPLSLDSRLAFFCHSSGNARMRSSQLRPSRSTFVRIAGRRGDNIRTATGNLASKPEQNVDTSGLSPPNHYIRG